MNNDLIRYSQTPDAAEVAERAAEALVAAGPRSSKGNPTQCEVNRRKYMSLEEIEVCAQYAAMRANTSPKWRFYEQVFLLACGPGLWVSEIKNLRIADVRLTLPKPHVWIENGRGGFSGPTQIPWAWAVARMGIFLKWRQDEYGHSEPCDFWYLRPMLGGQAKDVYGPFMSCLEPLPPHRQKEIHPHCGRHTAAAHLLDAGHTLQTVSKFLRHKTLASTLRYLHAGDIQTGDLYGSGQEEMTDQITEAWHGPRDVEKLRVSLEDLALQTPDGSRVDPSVTRRMQKRWRLKQIYGERMDRMLECYRVLAMPPSLYGDYFEDREWREVVVWRWLSWEYHGKELDFHYGQARSPALVGQDDERGSKEGSESVVPAARV